MEPLQTTWTSERTLSFLFAMVGDEVSFYGRLMKHALPGDLGWHKSTLPSARPHRGGSNLGDHEARHCFGNMMSGSKKTMSVSCSGYA